MNRKDALELALNMLRHIHAGNSFGTETFELKVIELEQANDKSFDTERGALSHFLSRPKDMLAPPPVVEEDSFGKWYHRSEHVDGKSYRMFDTKAEALASVAQMLGDGGEVDTLASPGVRWVDDNGGTHEVHRVPYGVKSCRGLLALEEAYDARECGTATPAQKAMLTRLNF